MINHSYIIPFDKFNILLIIFRIKLSTEEKEKVYGTFKDIFQYDTCFTYLDEDTEMINYTLNCKYVIEQICVELGIKL